MIKQKESVLSSLKFSDALIDLRPIDEVVVSRYRLAMRSGAHFPALVIDADTDEIVCGNHRATAAMREFGSDATFPVEHRKFKDRAEQLTVFADDNARHGMPLDGVSRRRVMAAMIREGMTAEQVASVFNVPVQRVSLATAVDSPVTVTVGRGTGSRVEPIKAGTFVPDKRMSESDYKRHTRTALGVSVKRLALELSERIENGWYDAEDEEEVNALRHVRDVLKEI